MKKITSTLIMLLILISCQDSFKEVEVSDFRKFFPLETTRTYSVFEVRYEIEVDTIEYMLRESIFDSLGFTSEDIFAVVREKKESENDVWRVDSLWTVKISPNNIVLREDGIDRVKLVADLEVNSGWDENAYNIFGVNRVFANLTGSVPEFSDFSSEFVYVEIQEPFRDIIEETESYEIYAAEIGLVEKKIIDLKLDNGEISNGRIYHQKLIGYEE